MEIINIIFLALIQGITEFLPISSSSHLVLFSELTNFPDQGLGFDIALHTGSLLAILIYFRAEIKKILFLTDEGHQYLKLIIIASVPLPIIGYIFIDYISIFDTSANFFANSTGCRFWCCFNDFVECNSSTRRWKSYYRYNGQCIVGLFSKSNNNWFINNISFWSNFKSTYIKKEISFINGHKVQRHET